MPFVPPLSLTASFGIVALYNFFSNIERFPKINCYEKHLRSLRRGLNVFPTRGRLTPRSSLALHNYYSWFVLYMTGQSKFVAFFYGVESPITGL